MSTYQKKERRVQDAANKRGLLHLDRTMEKKQPLIKGAYLGLLSTYHTPHICGNCSSHIAFDWSFCPDCGTPTGLSQNDVLKFQTEIQKKATEYCTLYAPGDTIYDETGAPWSVKVAELREIRDGLHWLYRCGHYGTEDYCALFDWEVVAEQDAPQAREREKARLERLFHASSCPATADQRKEDNLD